MNALLAAVLLLAASPDVGVELKTKRIPVTKPAKAVGNDFVETRLTLDSFKLWHRVAVDPRKGDEPVRYGYGEFFFGCEFGRQGNGGWDLWHFTSAEVADPKRGDAPFGLHRKVEGFHVVERGPRAVVDVVWWPEGRPKRSLDDLVTMRFVKHAAEREWCFIETGLEPGSPLRLAQVSYSAYPAHTSGPPGRERWVTTAARSHNLMTGGIDLDPAKEWAISLHNKHAHERAGSLLVFDPDEVAAVRVEGSYGVSIELVPKPGRTRLHVAVSYFLREHFREANAAFLAAAPRSLDRLRREDWEADLDRVAAAWRREMAGLADPLSCVGMLSPVVKRLDQLAADYAKALADARARRAKGEPASRRRQRQFSQFLTQLHTARQEVFAAAVDALLNEGE